MVHVIIEEMGKGNFSFLILVVGVLQLFLMWKNGRQKHEEKGKKIELQDGTS